jgi:hypothetical protein
MTLCLDIGMSRTRVDSCATAGERFLELLHLFKRTVDYEHPDARTCLPYRPSGFPSSDLEARRDRNRGHEAVAILRATPAYSAGAGSVLPARKVATESSCFRSGSNVRVFLV